MPPPVKHDECVIIFDKNVTPEFFAKAKQCLLDIYGNKWCRGSKDLVCLLPFGEKLIRDDDFRNYRPVDVKNAIDKSEKNNGQFLEALLYASKILERRSDQPTTFRGVITRQLLYISDFSSSPLQSANDTSFNQIVGILNKIKGFLYILGPEVELSQTLMNFQDFQRWIGSPVFVQGDNENLNAVKKLVQAVDCSAVCGLELGCDLFKYYRNYAVPQQSVIPLTAGTRFSFTNRDVRMLRKFSYLKIRSNNEYRYVLAENLDVEVDFNETVRALNACGKMITMPADVRDYCRSKGERCFELVGCAERADLQLFYYVGDGTHKVYPANLFDEWTLALCKVLKEMEMVAIVAKRVIKNTRRKMFALIPEEGARWFYMVQMPFSNEIKKHYPERAAKSFLEMPDIIPEHETAIYNYLDTMELSVTELPLNVTMTSNPHFKRYWRYMTQKSLRDDEEPDHCDVELLGKTPLVDALTGFWPEREQLQNNNN